MEVALWVASVSVFFLAGKRLWWLSWSCWNGRSLVWSVVPQWTLGSCSVLVMEPSVSVPAPSCFHGVDDGGDGFISGGGAHGRAGHDGGEVYLGTSLDWAHYR